MSAAGWSVSGDANTATGSHYADILGARLRGGSGLSSIEQTVNTSGRTHVVVEYYRRTEYTEPDELLTVQGLLMV